jgi:hypothetical protein
MPVHRSFRWTKKDTPGEELHPEGVFIDGVAQRLLGGELFLIHGDRFVCPGTGKQEISQQDDADGNENNASYP